MAWTHEQTAVSPGTTPLAYASNVKAGSLLVAMMCHSPDDLAPAAPTDSLGNVYSLIQQGVDPTHDQGSSWWWAVSISAGANTVTFRGGASFDAYMISEYSTSVGSPSLGPVAFTYISSAVTTPDGVTSPSVITPTDGCLVLGFAQNTAGSGAATLTAGTGFTARGTTTLEGTGGQAAVQTISKELASPGSTQALWTINLAGASVITNVAIFPKSISPLISTPSRIMGHGRR